MQSSLMLKPNGQGLYMMPECLGSHHCVTNFTRICFALHNVFLHFNYLYKTMVTCWGTGYTCLPFMMTPYPEPEPGPQAQFNLAHSRTSWGQGGNDHRHHEGKVSVPAWAKGQHRKVMW